jgi:hypothetical protein
MFKVIRDDDDREDLRVAEKNERLTMVVTIDPELGQLVAEATTADDKAGFLFFDPNQLTDNERDRWFGGGSVIAVLDYNVPKRGVYFHWDATVTPFDLADKILECQENQP